MKKSSLPLQLFLLTALFLVISQSKVYASSQQVKFNVPVMIDGFAWKKVPRYITVTCTISKERRGKPVPLLLGSGKDKRPYRPTSTQKIHNAYVTVRAKHGKSFHKGDSWMCFAKKPNSTDGARTKLAVQGKL